MEEEMETVVKGMCDPRKSLCCWWDEYPIDETNGRCHAFTHSGHAVGCFCSEACSIAWTRAESFAKNDIHSIESLEWSLETDHTSLNCAPPKEAGKRFGGSLSVSKFRSFKVKKPITTNSHMMLGPQVSLYETPRYYEWSSENPFSICDTKKSKVCWWDGFDLPSNNETIYNNVFYASAKVVITKERFRFSESVIPTYADRTRDEVFVKYGAFCSRACRKAWVIHTFQRDPRRLQNSFQLNEAEDVLNNLDLSTTAPHKFAFNRFGGFMSLSEFRDHHLNAECTLTPILTPYDPNHPNRLQMVCYEIEMKVF